MIFRGKTIHGGLAQLGEHLLCKQGVVGSIPSSSTTTLKVQTQVIRKCRSGFGFDLLAIIAVSFFNNLEEVKFYVRPRQRLGRVVIVSTNIALSGNR